MSWQKAMRCFSCSVLLFASSLSFAANGPILNYESGEHVAAGDQVKLHFTADEPGQAGEALPLPNGLKLTYGEILSLGDFYEIVDQAISRGISNDDKRARFTAAFNSFATSSAAVTETPQILSIIQSEKTAVDEGMKRGEKPEDIYEKIGSDDNRQWNCVTGGDCSSTWWVRPGRYLKLAKKDFDHFGDAAWESYQIGHQLAMETAIAAHQTQDVEKLRLAYAMNSFASHFLADRFASGHMRTPRAELFAEVTPSVIGSLLVNFMHKEENRYGLHVHNLRDEHWIAYGDRYYYDAINDMNRDELSSALQNSADQIFEAYQSGTLPKDDSVGNALPIVDETGNTGQIDIAPLFYWDNATKTVYRRSDVSNVNDRHWTAHWWGWSTLILLARQHEGLSIESQAELVSAGYALEAMQAGLITDRQVFLYAKSVVSRK